MRLRILSIATCSPFGDTLTFVIASRSAKYSRGYGSTVADAGAVSDATSSEIKASLIRVIFDDLGRRYFRFK